MFWKICAEAQWQLVIRVVKCKQSGWTVSIARFSTSAKCIFRGRVEYFFIKNIGKVQVNWNAKLVKHKKSTQNQKREIELGDWEQETQIIVRNEQAEKQEKQNLSYRILITYSESAYYYHLDILFADQSFN